jgi:hypothetical protein
LASELLSSQPRSAHAVTPDVLGLTSAYLCGCGQELRVDEIKVKEERISQLEVCLEEEKGHRASEAVSGMFVAPC